MTATPQQAVHRSRLIRVAGVVVLAASAALLGLTTPADAASTQQPTNQARAAGITKGGEAYMGWFLKSTTRGQIAAPPIGTLATQTPGIDVSGHQNAVDWAFWWNQGKRFAYVKATEGTYYRNEDFTQQYNGSFNIGMIRGSYHFANPRDSSGAAQANFFVDHGGGWSRDGKTLPGALDIEYNPYAGGTCYGLSQAAMVNWIRDFTNTYRARTGRDAPIYSTTDWWVTCTGNNASFASTNPLWIARYSSSVGTLPAGWGFYTIWQFTSSPIDQDNFNGAIDRLQALANG